MWLTWSWLNLGVLWTGDQDSIPGAQDALTFLKDQVSVLVVDVYNIMVLL